MYENAAAYELLPDRWDRACLTHDADPMLTAALAQWAAVSGVRDCGVTANPDLRVVSPSPEMLTAWSASRTIGGATIYPKQPGTRIAGYCEIRIAPAARGWQTIWTHELGHCLGLAHSTALHAIMAAAPDNDSAIGADDIAGIRAIWGPPVRAWRIAVSVANDGTRN